MAVVRCQNGHFYDNIKYRQCPYCSENLEEEKTVSFSRAFGDVSGRDDAKTVVLKAVERENDEDHTISIYAQQKGLDFITGWLVCVDGSEKGRDYRLHQGFNRIGRDFSMDVVIADETVPVKKAMCAIVYDDHTNSFFAVEQSGGEVYLDGESVQGAVRMNDGSILRIGSSEYEFVAFCREGRTW